MNRHAALALLALTLLAVPNKGFAQEDRAAIACMPPAWSLSIPMDTQIDVPIEGVLVLSGSLTSMTGVPTPTEALQYISVVVTDAAAADVPGALSYDTALYAVVWRAAAPLEAGATYQVVVTVDNVALETLGQCGMGGAINITGSFTMVAAADPVAPVTTATNTSVSLGEWMQSVMACCKISEDPAQCYVDPRGYDPCEMCWVDHREYLPQVSLSWTTELDAAAAQTVYYSIERKLADGTFEHATNVSPSQANLLIQFNAIAESYCVRIVAHQVVDGSEAVGNEVCALHTDLVPVTRVDVTKPDLSQCIGDVTGEDLTTNQETAKTDDCGCQLSGTPHHSGALSLLLLAAVGLLAGARRRA